MQEEVEDRTVRLAVTTAEMSGRAFQDLIRKADCYLKERKRKAPHGKQSVKQLVGQGQGVASVELTDPDIRRFERIASTYGVDFAIKKDCTPDEKRYLVFFKAKDAEVLGAAFRTYTEESEKRDRRPSLRKKLDKDKANREKTQSKGRERERVR